MALSLPFSSTPASAQVHPQTPPVLKPLMEKQPLTTLLMGESPEPTLIATWVRKNADVPAGLWLRSLNRGPIEAKRMHLFNALVSTPKGNGCPDGGQAVLCFAGSTAPRSPTLMMAGPDQLWVLWVVRETQEHHSFTKEDRRPTERTLVRTVLTDHLRAAPITMSDRQWMQGPAVSRKLEALLPDDVQLEFAIIDGMPTAFMGAQRWALDQREYAWNTGALLDRPVELPPPPPPPPPPKICRGKHKEDCGNGCVDLRRSRRNCGGCGHDCGKYKCSGGVCGPHCYRDRDCRNVFGVKQGRCYTELVQLRGTPMPEPSCDDDGDCGRWMRCNGGSCVPLKCRTSSDCPKGGRARCLKSGAHKVCIPRGQCVANFLVPQAPPRP